MMENAENSTAHCIERNAVKAVEEVINGDIKSISTKDDIPEEISNIGSNVIDETVKIKDPATIPAVKCEVVREETKEMDLPLHTNAFFEESVHSIKRDDCSSDIECKTENVAGSGNVKWPFMNVIKPEQLSIKEEKVVPDKNDSSDKSSRVTLKRRSDSLALISSYDISSESDEELHKSAFTKTQKPLEIIDSSSDSESDSGSILYIDSDEASNESSQSSEEDNNTDDGKIRKQKAAKGAKPKTTLNCLDFGELPPIKDLQISVKEDECLPFGKVHSIVETLVVIESLPDVPALNLDSVLFTKSGEPLGEVFDVFGPVKRPYYTIRFKSRGDIDDKSLAVGTSVYCAPKTKYTQYVFIHQLARMKGSDASWKNDMEPPPECLDYSDDEQERVAKKTLKEAKAKARILQLVDKDTPPIKIRNTFEERMNQRNTLRNQMFIRNSPPDGRRMDWYRTAGGASNDSPRSSGRGIVRPSQFTPIQFQRQSNPMSPSFFSQHNIGRNNLPSTSIGTFPIRNPIFSSVFQIRSPGLFPPPRSQNNLNGNLYTPTRPPPCLPHSSQGFQGNNNLPFPAASPPFSQHNNLDFPQQPSQFSGFQSSPQMFQSQSPQYSKVSKPGPFPRAQSPPFQQGCPLLPGGLPPYPCSRPLQPASPLSFGPTLGRPFAPNSPPYAPPSLFSLPVPNIPPQRSLFSPNPPFANNPPHQHSFRPFKPK